MTKKEIKDIRTWLLPILNPKRQNLVHYEFDHGVYTEKGFCYYSCYYMKEDLVKTFCCQDTKKGIMDFADCSFKISLKDEESFIKTGASKKEINKIRRDVDLLYIAGKQEWLASKYHRRNKTQEEDND